MKKFLSTLTAMTFIIGLCSCSSETAEEKSKPESRISTKPLDTEIIGLWMNDYIGYRFGDNRKISLVIDFSERGHFTADGEFYTAGAVIPKENVSYDGTNLKAVNVANILMTSESDSAILVDMERMDEANEASMDGHYSIKGGVVTKVIASELNINAEKVNFEGDIEGEKLTITLVNCMDYETDNGKLDFFSELFNYVDENANSLSYTYQIKDNELTMQLESVENAAAEVYKKVE